MLPDLIYMETSGSPFMSLTVWFMGGIVAFFGSICYAELATSINVSGKCLVSDCLIEIKMTVQACF